MPADEPVRTDTRGPSAVSSFPLPLDTDPISPAAEHLPDLPGYQVEAELGRGGMGVVFRATHLALKQPRAVKVLLAGRLASPVARQRERAEAELLAGIDHPNVIRVHDAGDRPDGTYYLAMELAPGGSLSERLKAGRQSVSEAVGVVTAVARGVAALHASGVVHRDLKPANVLFAADGTPKVADFGLAKLFAADGGLTATDAIMGTPAYMAPEQAEGRAKAVGPAADVWALGVILYECLTGQRPFAAATALATLDAVRFGKLVPPRRVNPAIPPGVEAVCIRCLRRDLAERYATAAEVVAALASPVAPRRRRRRLILATLTAALTAGGLTVRSRHAEPATVAVTTSVSLDSFALLVAVREYRVAASAAPPPDEGHPSAPLRLPVGLGTLRICRLAERSNRELADVLHEACGFNPQCMVELSQYAASDNPRRRPTGANIRERLRRMAGGRPEQAAVVVLNGRGYQARAGGPYYFCPEDGDPRDPTTLISEAELAAAMTACRASTKLLFVEATLQPFPTDVGDLLPNPPPVAARPFVQLLATAPDLGDIESGDRRVRLFSHALIQTILAAHDRGRLTVGELHRMTAAEMASTVVQRRGGPVGDELPPVLTTDLPVGAVLFNWRSDSFAFATSVGNGGAGSLPGIIGD